MADVLIVDDDADVAELAQLLLESRGHLVRRACDGKDGMRRLRERVPDLVVLDVEMPHLDGPGMAYEMFLHDAGLEDIPVVLVSGVVDLAAVARRVGTPYFLPKPFVVPRLLDAVDRALAERRGPTPELPPQR